MGLSYRRRVVRADWGNSRRWDLAGGLVMDKQQEINALAVRVIEKYFNTTIRDRQYFLGEPLPNCKPQKYDTMHLAAIANAVLVAAGSGFKYYEERTQNKIIETLRNALSQ